MRVLFAKSQKWWEWGGREGGMKGKVGDGWRKKGGGGWNRECESDGW